MPTPEEKLSEKVEELGRAFEDFKKSNDERLTELKSKKHVDPLLEEKVNKANADIDSIMEAKKALEKEISEVKTALNRSGKGFDPKEQKNKEALEKKEAFLKFLRKGEGHLSADEEKALSVSSDVDGGYLVNPTVEEGIIRNLGQINALRGLATVRTISRSDALERRRRTQGVTAVWSGEQVDNPPAQNPKLGRLRIPAEEMKVTLYETAQLLEDAGMDVEAWLNDEAAEAFADLEGAGFILGDGAGKPRGILAYPAGTGAGQVEQVISGTAGTIADVDGQANGFINMVYSLKAAYAKNGHFILNRRTVGSLRKIKDGNKNYIWQPGFGSEPPTLFGYGYTEDDNMPLEGAGNLPIVFADFKKFYKIVDRLGMSVIRDPFTSKPDVEFLFRKRVGGGVEVFEAGKILKCSA